ncbi:hypothetical protein D187_001307 [Cystobacter fuscus DSM 2262]|uniref:Uncharacterized protein n=1 Tax=Cystobacter fuscus (strain ATCC 25194 / DSM 2262 / NBRC 100088 / M29) TaxID=1242864 RepID=S9QVJ1_CYSF2|nr:hypothetical protein [Cystobacter fuscus]EPX60658.1 hypothetical protein D187_001307 [Cystobacter fuscus DSM 2262]
MALLGALLAGCETYFVDPYPPEISTLSRERVVKAQDTPVVYGLVFDLHIPNAAECTRVKEQLRAALRAALLPTGREGMEFSPRDLSPGCVQPNSRSYPYWEYAAQVRQAEELFGRGRVKPVLLYFNNVELPLPSSLREDFINLQNGGGNAPQLWALTTQEVLSNTRFAQSAPWTYSSDPRLTARLAELARAQLPFIQLEQPSAEGFALFTPQELSWVREFKGCTRPSGLDGANFVYGPQSIPVNAAQPPRFRVTVPQQEPVPRNQRLEPVTVRFTLEVCREHCERFFSTPEGELLAWNATPRCFLTGPR